MKKLLLTPLLALALFAGLAIGPGKAVADGCAMATVSDASACGGRGQLVWAMYTPQPSGYWKNQCQYQYAYVEFYSQFPGCG